MTPEEQADVLKMAIQNRAEVAGQLLLFRYLDFAVEPGQVYRYRIRFRIYNPFFGSPPEWLADASVGEGEIRFTEWSEPSPPIQVETDSEYFLVDVNPGAGITSLPKASLDVFQWHADAGTLVDEEMDLLAGEAISDEVKTEVLRPVEQTFAEEEIILDTRSMLVDAMAAPSVNPDLHPDLAFTPAQARSGLGITEQALIMDRFGRLKVIDSATQQRQHKNAQAMLRMQSSEYDSLREPEEVDEDELDRAARGMTKGAFGKAKGAKRTQNPNRKGR